MQGKSVSQGTMDKQNPWIHFFAGESQTSSHLRNPIQKVGHAGRPNEGRS